ncbi:tetratricopeptide repeat protein [Sungkyunkwania multivorans]|uniref:Tetratricopeptide repeat protein n=1 Tax=Sungkyunkwania multivorans TaxID=1173618 RepID=A0ABW3CXB1_9FLAO
MNEPRDFCGILHLRLSREGISIILVSLVDQQLIPTVKKGTLTFIFLLISLFLKGQNDKIVDSLLTLVRSEQTQDTTKIKAYNDLGIQYGPSDPTVAKSYIRKAMALAEETDRPRGVAGAYNCLGIVYYYQKELDSARISFEKAYEINLELQHAWGQASALNQIGVIQSLQDNYYDAIQTYKDAGAIFLSLGDSIAYTKSIENIGFVYSRMGHRQRAAEHLFEAIRLYDRLNFQKGIERGYYRMSSILIRQKDYEKALEYIEKSIPAVERDGDKYVLSSMLHDKGFCLIQLKRYQEALSNLERSLNYRKALSNKKGLAHTQTMMGMTYYKMKEYPKSYELLTKAIANQSEEGYTKEKIRAHNYLAKTHNALNQLGLAKKHANIALNLAKEIANIEQESEVTLTLASIAEHQGRSDEALNLYKKHHVLNDSINSQEQQNRVQELRTIYETDKKEQELALKNKEIELLEQKQRAAKSERILLIILIAGLLLLSGSLLYGLRQKLKRNQLEKEKVDSELAFKRKELTTHALHLAKKNEVLEGLKQQAEALKASSIGESGYHQLIRTINFDLKDDNNWENFARYFEQVHKDFSSNAKKNFPGITSNELRLMALLKMNLSSKEIANILNISQEGIKKARYRLRKKLNITTDESLQDIVLSL